MENGIFNLRKSADLLFSVDYVSYLAKSSFSWFWCISWFTLFSVFSVRFASRYRLSVAFGSKVVDRTLNSTTKYTNHTKPGSPATLDDYAIPISVYQCASVVECPFPSFMLARPQAEVIVVAKNKPSSETGTVERC